MLNKITFAIVAICLVVVFAQAPKKPVWPLEFDVPFYMSNPTPLIVNSSSHLYYNWNLEAQVIDYKENCLPMKNPQAYLHPCKLYFVPAGIYLSQPALGVECCELVPGVGSIPPEFLKAFNFTRVETAYDMHGKAHTCNRWDADGGFTYWTETGTGLDIAMNDGDTHWAFGDFHARKQHPGIFSLPHKGDCSQACK